MTSYYELDAANDRVGELRPLLSLLRDDRDRIATGQLILKNMQSKGADRAQIERGQEQMTATVRRMELIVRRIDAWGIALRDISTGQVDIPALANGQPIWLCWNLDEPSIEFGHRQDEDCAMQQPLADLHLDEGPAA